MNRMKEKTMNPPLLSASVMCAPQWSDIADMLREMQEAGIHLLHADVMDGQFVPNLMLGTKGVKELRSISRLPLDLHFMVENPEEKLGWFDIQPGEYVSVHAESTCHLQRILTHIRKIGAHPMAALNPATPLCMMEEVLPDLDGVVIMTVNPGFAGQMLIPQMLQKIARARKMLDDAGYSHIRIEVDGNVSFENARKMRKAGADMFVCGTAGLFSREGTIVENILRMRRCIADFDKEGES